MRKNLKKKLINVIEVYGPQMFDDFQNFKLIKRKKTGEVNKSNLSDSYGKSNQYYYDVALNEAFGSLKEIGNI